MPFHRYACRRCDASFRILRRKSEEGRPVCPHCGGETEKLPPRIGVVYKGTGYYATDYRSEKGKVAKASREGAGEPGTTAAEAGRSEG
jgi:putative FmdB family regulatory protein